MYFMTVSGGFRPLLEQTLLLQQGDRAHFVANISKLGESDHLLQNKIEIPYGQTLDIIALDTRTLKESDSDWRIVVGFHQLVSWDCKKPKMEEETSFEPLHKILLQYGVIIISVSPLQQFIVPLVPRYNKLLIIFVLNASSM
ncbi:hypothetical protein Pfo_003438 [Paulownia fortunei]|nr:hypothetical protein Pfo_003438 [Paulownia fortunei]